MPNLTAPPQSPEIPENLQIKFKNKKKQKKCKFSLPPRKLGDIVLHLYYLYIFLHFWGYSLWQLWELRAPNSPRLRGPEERCTGFVSSIIEKLKVEIENWKLKI